MALLVVISFYFELLQDYDLLSLLLGFVVCIILQFSFLSYQFQDEMKKFKMDEVGIRTPPPTQSSGRSNCCSATSTSSTSIARTPSSTTATSPTTLTDCSLTKTRQSTRT
jgi:hypothetical protein